MANSDETNRVTPWAVEIVRQGSDQPSEFFSIVGLQVGRENVQILTDGGTQITFKTKNLRKILLMHTKDKTS